MSLQIGEQYFQELISGIRESDDPEELLVEVCDGEGNCIVFQNGSLFILSGSVHMRVSLEDLPEHQRYILHTVLIERVERIIDNIITEALL